MLHLPKFGGKAFLIHLLRRALTQNKLSRSELWLREPFGLDLVNVIYFSAEEDTAERVLPFIQFVRVSKPMN